MNKKNKKIDYYVQQLGKLAVKLCSQAQKCYNLLKQKGDIDAMKEIDQLGVIRGVYTGAHHTRWEYLMVQLSLVNLLSSRDKAK